MNFPRPFSSRNHNSGVDLAGLYARKGCELIEELRRFARGEAFDEQAMPFSALVTP